MIDPHDKFFMQQDLDETGLGQITLFDIRRPLNAADSVLGGVTVTSTTIDTATIDLQNLRGEEIIAYGGMKIEAQYRGFCHEDTDLQERDILSNNSGTTRYEITFIENLHGEHIEFLARLL